MCDQTMPYEPGTRVWAKTLNWIWWPGKIVDLKDTPEEFQDYVAEKKKNCIAVVFYETDKTHDPIINMNKIQLYDCPDKMEFVKKGYEFYEKQLKGHKIKSNIKMENFLKEVKLAEKDIGGDENIFEQFIEDKKDKFAPPKVNINDLFVSSKNKKKKRKSVAANKAIMHPDKYRIQSNTTKINNFRASMGISVTPTPGLFFCHGACGLKTCLFKTNRNSVLSTHLKSKVNTTSVVPKSALDNQPSGSNSNKKKLPVTPFKAQKSIKSKKTDPKQLKLREQLLRDWDEDSDEEQVRSAIFDFHDNNDDNNASIENVANSRRMKSTNSLLDNSGCTLNRINTFDESLRMIPKLNNASENENEKQNISDHNLTLGGSKSSISTETKESEANVEIKSMEDSMKADVKLTNHDLKLYRPETCSTSPHWIKEHLWDTLEDTQYHKVKKVLNTKGYLPDLSKLKLKDTLEPVPLSLPEIAEINDSEPALNIVPDEPEPGYIRHSLLVPVNKSAKIYSDEDLVKLPLTQLILKKIESGDTEDMYVEFPDAVILREE